MGHSITQFFIVMTETVFDDHINIPFLQNRGSLFVIKNVSAPTFSSKCINVKTEVFITIRCHFKDSENVLYTDSNVHSSGTTDHTIPREYSTKQALRSHDFQLLKQAVVMRL